MADDQNQVGWSCGCLILFNKYRIIEKDLRTLHVHVIINNVFFFLKLINNVNTQLYERYPIFHLGFNSIRIHVCNKILTCLIIFVIGTRESFRFRRRSTSDAFEKAASEKRPSPSSPFDVWEMRAWSLCPSMDDRKCVCFALVLSIFVYLLCI